MAAVPFPGLVLANSRFLAFVDGDSVSCKAYLIADHIMLPDPNMPIVSGENIATVVGEYTNFYEKNAGKWTICKSELAVHWSSGNIALFPQAAEK
ncbi:hypothetical protein LCGC14_2809610, partial [marine sediment metagenome]